jgi:hypothetical protein
MNAAVLMTPGRGVMFQRRTRTGGSTAINQVAGVVVPRWVKLVRTGNSFSAYHSADGVAWTQIGTSQTINIAASTTIGLALTSHADAHLCRQPLFWVGESPPRGMGRGINYSGFLAGPPATITLGW